ncbi:carbon-nitrogen hydrolase family protein [bacterium]|nr:carbon-nitrogen hydrolase family protein [bacterium]
MRNNAVYVTTTGLIAFLLICVYAPCRVYAQGAENKKFAPPRKIVIGTTMERFPGKYPGLEKRLEQIGELIDEVAREAERKYPGEGLDLVVLPEEVVTRDRGKTAETSSVPLNGPVLDRMGAKARQYKTYIVVPMDLVEEGKKGVYSNAAVLFDRSGAVAGIYRKVHIVAALGSDILEGGMTPGKDFPVFECDFGRLGIQICYDLSYRDGWDVLARKGAEIVALTTMSPQTSRPAAYAAEGRYYVVSSTPRNNISVFNPVGMIDAQTTKDRVLVHRIDLSYVIISWAASLGNGKAFSDKYGDRVGYTYYESEDAGIFWSNDPATPIGRMADELGFVEMRDEIERIRLLQDAARGMPPER